MNDIFTEINNIQERDKATFMLKVNYYEIYNEKFNDLLSVTPAAGENLRVRQTPN
jgi:hypothetical protein